ncbi:MAG: CARDB domain-containing protein [Gemmatimonadota bacterium]|nr:CARDB domain-containing protein [Gemmatimonadota bacterium]
MTHRAVIFSILSFFFFSGAELFAAAGCDLSVVPVAKMHREVIKGDRAQFTIDVQGLTPPVNQSVEITGPAGDIKLKLEGALDFSSIKALAAGIIKPGMTDEEKAKACFYFTGTNFYDRGGSGCEDPLEYVNLWGFSWCGNFGLFLNALWQAAGFRTVFLNPVLGMPGGHTISAVYYDNQWHMFDSRMRGYFLNRDNRTVASLVDLDRDDFLLRRGLDYSNLALGRWGFPTVTTNYFNASSDWYDSYNAHFDNETLFYNNTPKWDPRLDLRTGEKLTLNWTNQGKWWHRKELSPEWLKIHGRGSSDATRVEPIIYANGTVEFDIDPKAFRKQALESSGIRARNIGTTPVFMPSAPGKSGYVVYKVRAPYFIPSMKVEAEGFRKTGNDSLAIELSTDEGLSWLPLWSAEGTGRLRACVETNETQRVTMYKKNKYSYLLRLRLTAAGSAADAALGSIKITTNLFYRPMILPALKRQENRLTFTSRPKGGARPQVVFNWLENTNILFSEDKPCERDEITITALVRNKGDLPATDVAVRFYDGDPEGGGKQIGEDQVIARIGPRETARASVEWRAVKNQTRVSSSFSLDRLQSRRGYTHNTIYAVVDPDGKLEESNEANNRTCRDLVVCNMANLVLGDPSFLTFERRGDKVLMTAVVRNHNMAGPRPRVREARNVTVRFYDHQPVKGRMDQSMIGESVIPAIEPGEFGRARIEWDVKGLSGRYVVYVVVDPEDKIPETWQRRQGDYMLVKKEINL